MDDATNMGDSKFLDTQIAVESCLRTCSVDEMGKVARGLDISEAEWQGKSKAVVMRAIGGVLDEQESDEAKRTIIMKMLMYTPEKVTQMIMKALVKGDDDSKEELNSTRKATEELNQTMGQLLLGLAKEDGKDKELPRREFKINGVICTTARDSLNYISICSQIADAKKKNYPDDEIAMAVRRAVAPASSLRNYLDSKEGMTLEQTLKFIRGAMKEKSSTELFQELNNARQLPCEDAQKFVLRILDLRQRVMVASTGEGDISYDKSLVQAMFLHTIRTGLQDDAIKLRLEPFLSKTTTDDDVLIQELNTISSQEMERKMKIAGATSNVSPRDGPACDRASATVNEVTISGDQSSILEAIQKMSAQMIAMQKDMDEMRSGRFKAKAKRRRGCEHCKAADKADECRHCYRCGAGDHMIANCPKPASN